MSQDFEAALKSAEMRDPGNRFVASCRAFLANKGFLSRKQIVALASVTRTRNWRRDGYYCSLDLDDVAQDYFGFSD